MSSSPYAPAAQMLTQIWTQHKSIKTVAYDSKTGALRCSKTTYAQVAHVLESQSVLQQVLQRLMKDDNNNNKSSFVSSVRNEGLLYVLLYELLLGPNKRIRGGGALKRKLMAKEAELRRILNEIQQSKEETVTIVSFPRYARVNTLQTDTTHVVSILINLQTEFYADSHVPDLLVLPPGTDLHDDALVKSGQLVLQDKSSCFSALCLIHGSNQPLDGDCLDACAAPGNKTSHLAALLAGIPSEDTTSSKRKRTVYALDRSSNRLALLQRRMEHLIPSNHSHVQVVPMQTDFLKTDPSQFPSIRGILLDPSCSGSGIFTSADRHGDMMHTDDRESRLESLSNFQLVTLKHAMSFPQVQRIVYSTCSLHDQENECVVQQALETFANEWQIVAPKCLSHWKRRGHVVGGLTEQQAACLIRADRDDDTNGFFVCYLERRRQRGGSSSSDDASSQTNAKGPLPATLTASNGISFYNGEFSVDQQSRAQAGGERPEESKDKSKLPQGGGKTHTENKSAVNKKRAKKLAWKRRQTELKLHRLQAKKNKAPVAS